MDEAPRDGDLLALFERAPCGYVVTGPDGSLARVNQTFLDMTGWARTELVGQKRFQHLLTPAGQILYENRFAPMLRLQGFAREVAFELVRRDGDPLAVLVSSTRLVDADGEPSAIASVVFQATERRAYERELLAAQRRSEQLAAVVEMAGDAILTVSPDGLVRSWNPAAERLFGYGGSAMLGRRLEELLPGIVERGPRSGRAVFVETVGRRADGEPIDVSVGLAPHLGLLGEVEVLSCIVRDVSERRRAERQLEAERDAFLATLSHDMRNPLTVIVEYARMLGRRVGAGAPPWLERPVEQIAASADRSVAMLDELLDLAGARMGRTLALDRAPTDLVALVWRAIAEREGTSTRHRFEVRTDGRDLIGDWDPARLARVFDNLIGNAVKYSPNGGPITVLLERDDDVARVVVRDRGIGIPAADLPRVGDEFARASNAVGFAGAGIGLASVRLLVAAHGGSVEIESEEGRGTTVSVRLPLVGSGREDVGDGPERATGGGRGSEPKPRRRRR